MLLAFITNPVFWIIAAIGVLLILIDDFMTYLDGGESEFGEFWGAMLGWIDKAKKAWSEFSEDAKSAIKALIVALGLLASSGIIVKSMTVVFAILGKTIGFILSPVRLLIGLIGTLGKAFLLLGKVILANPIILVVALIAAVGYAIYDLIKWLKTGESAFGGFWQVVANIWNLIVANVTSAINKMVDAISSFISRIGAIFSNVFAVITTPFRLAFDWIMDKFSKLPSLIGNIISKLPGVNAISAIGSAVSSGVSRVTNNYGGNTTASINVTAPNATSAASQTAAALQGAQAQRNLGGQALA